MKKFLLLATIAAFFTFNQANAQDVLGTYSVTLNANNTVTLKWKAQLGEFITKFELQRSTNGTSWSILGSAPGNNEGSYTLPVSFFISPKQHFRVKIYWKNGTTNFTAVSTYGDPGNQIKIGPNPSSNYINIMFPTTLTGPKVVTIYRPNGTILYQFTTNATLTTLTTEKIPPGTYYLRITNNDGLDYTTNFVFY